MRPVGLLIASLSGVLALACEQDHLIGTLTDGASIGAAGGAVGSPGPGANATDGEAVHMAGGAASGELTCAVPCQLPNHRCVADTCIRVLPARSYAMGNSTICLASSGEILCSGEGSSGQLGNAGVLFQRFSFAPTAGSEPLSLVFGGVGDYFMGASGSGKSYAWGSNHAGALGLGDTQERHSVTEISGQPLGLLLVPGSGHSCLLTIDGALSCVGRNADGELGQGDQLARTTPVPVPGIYAHVSTGWGHTCALSLAGELFCWGLNDVGQLGLGDQELRLAPTRVSEQKFLFVSAQVKRTCALDLEGHALCWGDNEFGQAGRGARGLASEPGPVDGNLQFSMIAGGRYGVCAVARSGELYCWGKPPEDLNDTPSDTDLLVPTRVTNDADFTWVSRGFGAACAQKTDESIWCWGRNQAGQFGSGDVTPRDAPMRVGP